VNGSPQFAIRRSVLRLMATMLAVPAVASVGFSRMARAALPPVVVWKDANCGCCGGWIKHMEGAGFSVRASNATDMAVIKKARGVPDDLWSCHTAVVDGYVIEGHVPAADIVRLLDERPAAKGLAAPGMPASAPGMDQPGEAYTVTLFGAPDGNRTFAQHNP
jgi:hypothetical protein